MPSPTWAGVFGMVRTIASCPRPPAIDPMRAPATIEMTRVSGRSAPRSSSQTAGSTCGLTDNTTRPALPTAVRLSRVDRILNRCSTALSRPSSGSDAVIASGSTRS